jgi:hypothetical protein
MRRTTRILRLAVTGVALAAISCVTSYDRDDTGPLRRRWNKVVTGWGAAPIDARVTSLWLLGSDAGGTAGSRPLVMVYYAGSPGWHDIPWSLEGDFERAPAFVRLLSHRLELSVQYDGPTRASVQGVPVDLTSANVFLLSPVDGVPSLTPLAKIAFDAPRDENPALELLRDHPAIYRIVVPAQDEVQR